MLSGEEVNRLSHSSFTFPFTQPHLSLTNTFHLEVILGWEYNHPEEQPFRYLWPSKTHLPRSVDHGCGTPKGMQAPMLCEASSAVGLFELRNCCFGVSREKLDFVPRLHILSTALVAASPRPGRPSRRFHPAWRYCATSGSATALLHGNGTAANPGSAHLDWHTWRSKHTFRGEMRQNIKPSPKRNQKEVDSDTAPSVCSR